jgi:hypothetical protein
MLGSVVSDTRGGGTHCFDNFDGDIQRDGYNVLKDNQTRAELSAESLPNVRPLDLQEDDDRVEVDVFCGSCSDLVVIGTATECYIVTVYTVSC